MIFPRCLASSCGGGVHKHKQTELSSFGCFVSPSLLNTNSFFFRNLLANLKYLFILLLLVIMPTASIDTNVVYTTILLKFGAHPSKDLLWFSDTLDARYSKKMEPREYAKLFSNGAPVRGGDAVDFELKTDAITNLNAWIHKHIKGTAGIVNNSDNDRAMLLRLSESKTRYMLKNGSFATIEDVDDLAHAYTSFATDPSNTMKLISNDSKYLVLWKDTSLWFPADSTVNGKDWEKILDAAPTIVAPSMATAAAGLTAGPPHLQQTIADGIATMAKTSSAAEDAAAKKYEIFNVNDLKNDAKDAFDVYNKRANHHRITLSDMPLFCNSYTMEPTPGGIQKACNFIEYPGKPKLTAAGTVDTAARAYILYRDGTMFRHMTYQTERQAKAFMKCLRPVKVWNPMGFRKFYKNVEQECWNHFLWVLPYNLQVQDKGSYDEGFLCEDWFNKERSDLPLRWKYQIPNWSSQLDQAFRHAGVLPAEALSMLDSCEGNGFLFLRKASYFLHPALMDEFDVIKLISKHPEQGQNESFDAYREKADFYYNTVGLLQNTRMDFGDTYTQNLFVLHLVNSAAIQLKVTAQRESHEQSTRDKYNAGNFLTTIQNIDMHLRPPQRASQSRFPPRSSSSDRNSRSSSRYSQRTPSLHSLSLDGSVSELSSLQDHATVDDPESLYAYCVHGLENLSVDDDLSITQNIYAVSEARGAAFDKTRACAICGATGHSFDGCPELQGDVKKAYIRLRLILNRAAKNVDGTSSAHSIDNSSKRSGRSRKEVNVLSSLCKAVQSTNKTVNDIAGRLNALEGSMDDAGDDDASDDSSGTAGTINALLDADNLSDFLAGRV